MHADMYVARSSMSPVGAGINTKPESLNLVRAARFGFLRVALLLLLEEYRRMVWQGVLYTPMASVPR